VITDEPWLTLPPDHTIIWRYFEACKFKSLMEQKALWFTRGDRFDDDFEGTLPKLDEAQIHTRVLETFGGDLQGAAVFERWRRQHRNCLRNNTLVSCWHINDTESRSMWDGYVKSGEGVAVRTTVRRLLDSFPPADPRLICVGEVMYVDHEQYRMSEVGTGGARPRPVPQSGFMEEPGGYRAFVYKKECFAEEHELRLMFARIPIANGRADYEKQLWTKGDLVEVAVDHLFDAVVLSPSANQEYSEAVYKLLLEGECPDVPVRLSTFSQQ